MKPQIPSFDSQKDALTWRRSAQFEVLMSSGIMAKVISQQGQPSVGQYGEALPVILGSTYNDTLCLFVGLELINAGDRRTKYLLVGSKTEAFTPNASLGFNEADCEVVEGLYEDLKEFVQHEVPNYNLETGILHDGSN